MSNPDPETPENPYLSQPAPPAPPNGPAGQSGPAAYGPHPSGPQSGPQIGPVTPYGMPGQHHPQPYGAPTPQHPHHPQPFGSYGAGGMPVPWGPPPDHPNATTAMCLGIAGIVAFPPLAPVAWVMGGRARREIDASGGHLGGRSQATTGYVTGIVGSVMLGLFVAWFGFIIAVIAGM